MVSKIIHRVFVSSTYEDLREERAEVQKALLKLDCFPAGMEWFPSADEETWDLIKRQIEESDYYVVIVAGRYGSLASDGISYTEKEYDYAREKGIPAIGFLCRDVGKRLSNFVETEQSQRDKLETFKDKIKKHHVRFFDTPHELASEVVTSLVDLRNSKPRSGFVRADAVPDTMEYARLLKENQDLKEQIAATAKPEPFPGAFDVFTLHYTQEKSTDTNNTEEYITITIKMAELFIFYSDSLLSGKTTSYEIRNFIAEILCRKFSINYKENDNYKKIVSYSIIDAISRNFFGIGLLQYGINSRIIMDRIKTNDTVWKLTDYGQQQYGLLRRMLAEKSDDA